MAADFWLSFSYDDYPNKELEAPFLKVFVPATILREMMRVHLFSLDVYR